MKKSLHFLRKVAEDIWAIRERYFESSINYANLFFFQVRALLSIFSNVILESKYLFVYQGNNSRPSARHRGWNL